MSLSRRRDIPFAQAAGSLGYGIHRRFAIHHRLSRYLSLCRMRLLRRGGRTFLPTRSRSRQRATRRWCGRPCHGSGLLVTCLFNRRSRCRRRALCLQLSKARHCLFETIEPRFHLIQRCILPSEFFQQTLAFDFGALWGWRNRSALPRGTSWNGSRSRSRGCRRRCSGQHPKIRRRTRDERRGSCVNMHLWPPLVLKRSRELNCRQLKIDFWNSDSQSANACACGFSLYISSRSRLSEHSGRRGSCSRSRGSRCRGKTIHRCPTARALTAWVSRTACR